jgi:hypothetical protein
LIPALSDPKDLYQIVRPGATDTATHATTATALQIAEALA